MPATLLKVVVRRVNKSRPPFMDTAVKVDKSFSNDSSENLAPLIRDVMTQKKSLFQYSDDDIKEVETGCRTDICDFLKEPFSSGWGYFIIYDGMINVVVDPYQITSRLPTGALSRIVVEY